MSIEQMRVDRNRDIVQSLLHILLVQIQRCIDSTTQLHFSKKYLVIYKQFKKLLDNHFTENKAAAYYAEKLHITGHHLNLITKNVTGKTASEVIRARGILEAKRMLSFTDCTVAEVAHHLNYIDSSYFSKIFRAEIGKTPAVFKKEMSGKYRIK